MIDMIDLIIAKYNYWAFVILMMIGFYAMIVKKNLIKKIIGMNIFQTSIILFFISTACKKGGTLPILKNSQELLPRVSEYINPLPHVLMLTAIVVMVATLGVALAAAILIYRRYDTLEEDEIYERLK